VLEACLLVAAYMISLWLLALEKRSMLPSIPTRGQGLVLLIFWALLFIRESLMFVSWNNPEWWWHLKNEFDTTELGLFVLRYILVITLLILGFVGPSVPTSSYGLITDEESGRPQGNESTWKNVWVKMRTMFPYVWPKNQRLLQITVFICLIILGAGRAVNVFVPIYSKKIVNSLTYDKDNPEQTLSFRWDYIIIFTVFTFLKGGGTGTTGLLNNMRSLLWIKIQQYTTRSIQLKLFTHLHSLSLRWHLGRKTGEVLRVIDRGTNSINTLLSYILFQIFPTIADVVIAIVYFVTFFDYLFGLIVFCSMAVYLVLTVIITEWRTKFRRQMNLKDNEANARAVDSLLNFETVKYYEASDWERERYGSAILEFQKAEWNSTSSLNLLNLVQNSINTIGLAAGSLLCAWAVVHGVNDLQLTVGDYVLFGTYLSQLYVPLNWLGTYYRMIQQAFIDMENMFDLLEENLEIEDAIGAKDIVLEGGEIQFKNIYFHYEPSKPILKDLSFTVPAGQTYALVGHTGSGKSTIVRLLFRFYDVQSGCILIDGQDIREVTQKSLRQSIGVVPQDTVLFNSDIRYNIRYGNVTASDSQVEDAAEAAEIHSRILTFPKKYETIVGERGLKLSGGEKQRVAIARTLLKAPAIVLLDEVTQKSLRQSIGVVPQDTVLFNSDIRYNIRYGNVTASDSQVEDAAEAAEIHSRILTFPKKYETIVGERGLKLSGGEKQRVAIARTLLKAPAIVLLDEATSALDTKTERSIQSSLAQVCENRTTIVVAHRLSTIINADQIIVLSEGQILEMGTHQELLDKNGHYAEMWHSQLVNETQEDPLPDSILSIQDGNGSTN
ncbi:ATP-binding cassette sub-family b member 6, mitochondrial-like, partial [Plakobranchus ocellatus]